MLDKRAQNNYNIWIINGCKLYKRSKYGGKTEVMKFYKSICYILLAAMLITVVSGCAADNEVKKTGYVRYTAIEDIPGVTAADIAAKLGLDKKHIVLPEPIKAVGSYKIKVKLAHGIEGAINLTVEGKK